MNLEGTLVAAELVVKRLLVTKVTATKPVRRTTFSFDIERAMWVKGDLDIFRKFNT